MRAGKLPTPVSAAFGGDSVLLAPDFSLYLSSRLPRDFRRAGVAVDILCAEGNPLSRTRYARQVLVEAGMKGVARRLLDLLRDPQRPWRKVVVAAETLVHHLMAQADASVLAAWQPGALDSVAKQFFMDKFGLEDARENWNLPIPLGRACRTFAGVRNFGADVSWPIILKPPNLDGGRGVMKITGWREAAAAEPQMRFPCLAQKFIAGRMGVVDLLCARGRPLAWLASYAIKHTGGPFGPSTAKHFSAMPALAPLVEQVAACTCFEGFCGFDWIEEAGTGRHYLIEFHPRPTSGVRFGRACGVDFSAAVNAWLHGALENFVTLTQPAGTTASGHIFPYDLVRALRAHDWQELLPWLPGSGAHRDVFWDDPAVFFALLDNWWENRRRRRKPLSQTPELPGGVLEPTP